MSLIGNVVFFVFGGILLCLTIIGFPIAVQHMKLVPMALLPFGLVMRVGEVSAG